MKKYGAVFGIAVSVVFAYIIILAAQPATLDIISTANISASTSANISNYPETMAFVNSFPLWQWLIPGFIGVVSIVIILRAKK